MPRQRAVLDSALQPGPETKAQPWALSMEPELASSHISYIYIYVYIYQIRIYCKYIYIFIYTSTYISVYIYVLRTMYTYLFLYAIEDKFITFFLTFMLAPCFRPGPLQAKWTRCGTWAFGPRPVRRREDAQKTHAMALEALPRMSKYRNLMVVGPKQKTYSGCWGLIPS